MNFFNKKLNQKTDGVWCRVNYSEMIPFLCSKTVLQYIQNISNLPEKKGVFLPFFLPFFGKRSDQTRFFIFLFL